MDDPERPDPDLVLDDLASRRFHSPSPAPPTNFAMPMPVSPSATLAGRGTRAKVEGGSPCDEQAQEVTCVRSEHAEERAARVWMSVCVVLRMRMVLMRANQSFLRPEFAWFPVTMVMLQCAAFLTELRVAVVVVVVVVLVECLLLHCLFVCLFVSIAASAVFVLFWRSEFACF